MNNSLSQILLIIFYVMACGLLIKTLFDLYFNALAKKWNPIEVNILSSKIKEEQYRGNTSYKVCVNYSYQYKGHNYQSKRIAFGYQPNFSAQSAQVLFHRFESGKTVKAYINPNKPRVSVLIAGIRYFHLINSGLIAALIFFIHFVTTK